MDFRRTFWSTRPKTNRLAYYKFASKKALRLKGVEIDKDVEVEYKGTRFLVPKGFSEVLYSVYMDYSEPLTYRSMTNLTGAVFVDVGANVGGYTVRLGKRFGTVISIEPNQRAADVLEKNIELNRLANVSVVRAAISDTTGEATLNVPASGKTTRSSIIESYDGGSSFLVRTTTLDALLGGYDKIDLIKIDAEGAEVKVLKGGKQTLRKTLKLVLELGSWSEREITEILDGAGFEFSDLDSKVKTGRNVMAINRLLSPRNET